MLDAVKNAKSKVNAATEALTSKTIETIKNMDHDTAVSMLEKKWIDPLIKSVSELADIVVKDCIATVEKMAKKYDCQFLAASDVAAPSIVDQEHLNEEGHRALANAVLQKIIEQQIEKIISNEISISSDNLK